MKRFVFKQDYWIDIFRNPGWDGKGACAALAALAVLFYADKLVLGPWAAVRMHDVFDSDYSRYVPMGRMISSHGMISWFPNYAGGIPAYAWHHAPFYVLCLLTRVLPVWAVYGMVCLGLMAVAGWGMFRFLRERLFLSARNAFLGAVFFELAVQVQPNNIPETAFNYAFPAFYMWSLDLWADRCRPRRLIMPWLGILLLLLLAYPVLTLPYFALMHFILLGLDERLMQRRREALGFGLWSVVLWSGYILTCLPVLYALLGYAPEAARHYDAWRFPDLQALRSFLSMMGHYGVFLMSRSMTFIPMIAAAGLLGVSARLRKYFYLWLGTLVASAFFSSDLRCVFAGTLFGKMDLSHFIWLAPFTSTLAAVLGMDEISRRPEHMPRYRNLLGLAAALLVALTLLGKVAAGTLALNLGLGSILAAVTSRERFRRGVEIFSGFTALRQKMAAVLAAGAVLLLLTWIFRLQVYSMPNVLLFLCLAWMLFNPPCGGQEGAGAGERRKALALLILGLFFVFSVRMARFEGEEPENNPYKPALANHSFLNSLLADEAGPWRAGAVGGMLPEVLSHAGLETVDVRGPIMNRRYKEFFKRMVLPQLREKRDEDFFDAYPYNLYLMNADRKPDFNWPLLALANVRYLVSSEPSPQLQSVSSGVRTVPLDLRAAVHAWTERAGGMLPVLRPQLQRMGRIKSYHVYELKDAFPRFFLARQAVSLRNDGEVLEALSRASLLELGENAYFSQEDVPQDVIRLPGPLKKGHAPGAHAGAVKVVRYSPDRIELRVSQPGPAVLVVTNNFHEYWRASIDGAASKILRADHAFQAVLLPQAGEHDVILEFKDPYLGLAHLGIAAGALLWIGLLFLGALRPGPN